MVSGGYDDPMPARRGRVLALFVLLTVALAVAVVFSSVASVPAPDGVVAIDVKPVPLDPADPSHEAVGALRYLGGLWLRSTDLRFGGLSDLRVSPDGARLVAVSDCGHGFTASLSYDAAGRLAGLADARFVALTGPGGGALGLGEADAESLVVGDGLEVGFEGRPKILAYGKEPPFAGPARPLPVPPGVGQCGSNGGLEAMTDAGGGRRFLVCETRRGASSTVPAWIGRDGAWTAREYPLLFEGGWGGEPFRVSGAALLPDGDLLLVERRFPPIGARIVRLARASLDGTGPLEPREVARLEAPLTIDNFEGVDARSDASGRTLVYLISDDNNCSKAGSRRTGLQKTLLLLFTLEG
jgi:hypothetical protein